MAQMSGRPCPNCGSPNAANQRYCSNCGAVMEAQSQPPSQYGGQLPAQNYQQSWQTPSYAQQQVPPYMQQPQQQQNPIAEALGALGLLFLFRRYRRSGYVPRRQSSGCCGCLVLLVIFLIVFGLPIFFVARSAIPNLSKDLNISSSNNNSTFTTQPPITTAQVNQTVSYAGVDITIVNVQQSQTFLDDTDASTNGMVRLNLKESSKTGRGNYYYGDVARLVLPDKSTVAPANAKQSFRPDAEVTRTNWLDFPVPMSVKISQLTFQLGKDTEAQVNVPLTGKADLTQYQPKTVHPNVSTQYAGLTWTITSATVSLSSNGQQANKGMTYVTLILKVDNPSSRDFNAYWGDYIRLKSGDATSAPTTDTTLPLNFPAGSAGATGNVIFLMPSGNTSYTLIMLNTPSTLYSQATANFQIG